MSKVPTQLDINYGGKASLGEAAEKVNEVIRYLEAQQATNDEGTTPGEQASVPGSKHEHWPNIKNGICTICGQVMKPTIRTEIEACLPDLPRHALPYAVDAIMSKLGKLIGEDATEEAMEQSGFNKMLKMQGRNELRAEMRLRAGL